MISLSALASVLLYVVIVGLVFWLLWWVVEQVGLPEPFHKIAKVLLVLISAFIVLNILLGLLGHPIIRVDW